MMFLDLWLSSTNPLQRPRYIGWQDQAKSCRCFFNISLFEKSKQKAHEEPIKTFRGKTSFPMQRF